VKGYGSAYLVIGALAVVLVLLTLGLKTRKQELATAQAAQVTQPG
jgi:hypothetical protein